MQVKLSDHFTFKKLLTFTLPSIIMMVVTSVYGVVDGYFVSNYAGKTAFSAVNFIMPFLMILGTVGFMLGAGGSAIISKTLGEGNGNRANGLFSLFVYVTLIAGAILAVLGIVVIRPVAELLGAEGEMLEGCVVYGRIILIALPAYMIQLEFQSFFVTAEKPRLGLLATVCAGITNIVLDALFVAVFKWGVAGAAIATAISQVVGAVIPLVYFFRNNPSILRLGKAIKDFRALLKACTNGSSELMSNVSMSLVGMLYNVQLLNYAGENGVSAYGVLMYVSMIFNAVFIGYSVGTAPVIGYHFGAENKSELKNILKKSMLIIGIFSVIMVLLSEVLSSPLSMLFVGYDEELFSLTHRGFVIYSFSFLFMGFAIYLSSFFTALSDGLTSALISFLRTLVFQVAAVLLLPRYFDIDGIWFSIVAAEVMAAVVSFIFLFAKKKKYGYM